jgi:ribosomal protein S18 acetylase RimI-like enzyme
MILKKASLKDLDLITPLFDLYRQFYKQSSDADSAKEYLSDRIANNESVIFWALDEDNIAGMGFVQLYPLFSSIGMKRLWLLNDLFVHADYRKKGVGEALMEKAREFAVETNAKGIILETQKTNSQAQNLYDKLGYKRDKEHYYFYLETE